MAGGGCWAIDDVYMIGDNGCMMGDDGCMMDDDE